MSAGNSPGLHHHQEDIVSRLSSHEFVGRVGVCCEPFADTSAPGDHPPDRSVASSSAFYDRNDGLFTATAAAVGGGVLRGGAELKRSEENWRWASWVVEGGGRWKNGRRGRFFVLAVDRRWFSSRRRRRTSACFRRSCTRASSAFIGVFIYHQLLKRRPPSLCC